LRRGASITIVRIRIMKQPDDHRNLRTLDYTTSDPAKLRRAFLWGERDAWMRAALALGLAACVAAACAGLLLFVRALAMGAAQE
jgi:predicted membrane-bound spermidine synthase